MIYRALLFVLIAVATPQEASAATSIGGMIVNLVRDLETPVLNLISVGSYLGGLLFVAGGLTRLIRHSDDRVSHMAPPLPGTVLCIFVGVVLITFPSWLGGVTATMMGTESPRQVFSYGTGKHGADFNLMMNSVIRIINIIGLIFFIKGWVVLQAAGDGKASATYSAGIAHIVGGVLAWNFLTVLEAIQYSLGIRALTTTT